MEEHYFKSSGERTSAGLLKDSCLLCGKTQEAHQQKVVAVAKIKILWQGRFFEFDTVEDARKAGFHF